jgi:hypothetical protein
MLSKKSRHMRSLANFGSRHRIVVTVLRRRFRMNGCTLLLVDRDEAIQVVKHVKRGALLRSIYSLGYPGFPQVTEWSLAQSFVVTSGDQNFSPTCGSRGSTKIFIITNHFKNDLLVCASGREKKSTIMMIMIVSYGKPE